jgi:hypothetical protein
MIKNYAPQFENLTPDERVDLLKNRSMFIVSRTESQIFQLRSLISRAYSEATPESVREEHSKVMRSISMDSDLQRRAFQERFELQKQNMQQRMEQNREEIRKRVEQLQMQKGAKDPRQ